MYLSEQGLGQEFTMSEFKVTTKVTTKITTIVFRGKTYPAIELDGIKLWPIDEEMIKKIVGKESVDLYWKDHWEWGRD